MPTRTEVAIRNCALPGTRPGGPSGAHGREVLVRHNHRPAKEDPEQKDPKPWGIHVNDVSRSQTAGRGSADRYASSRGVRKNPVPPVRLVEDQEVNVMPQSKQSRG